MKGFFKVFDHVLYCFMEASTLRNTTPKYLNSSHIVIVVSMSLNWTWSVILCQISLFSFDKIMLE